MNRYILALLCLVTLVSAYDIHIMHFNNNNTNIYGTTYTKHHFENATCVRINNGEWNCNLSTKNNVDLGYDIKCDTSCQIHLTELTFKIKMLVLFCGFIFTSGLLVMFYIFIAG